MSSANKAIEMMLSRKSKSASRRDEIKVKYTDVHNLIPSKYNNYPIVDIEKLACFIKLSGDITPLTLRPLPDGKFTILSGHRRTQAVLYLLEQDSNFSPMIPYIELRQNSELDYLDEDDRERLAICLPNEGQRRDLSPAETAEILKSLRPVIKKIYDHGKENGTITTHFRKFFADFLDMSEAKIQRGEAYSKLSESLRAEVDAGTIAPTVAALLAGSPPDEQDIIIANIRSSGQEVTKQSVNEFLHPQPQEAAEQTEISSAVADDIAAAPEAVIMPESIREETEIAEDTEAMNDIPPAYEADEIDDDNTNSIHEAADDTGEVSMERYEAVPACNDNVLEKNLKTLKDYYDMLNAINSRDELLDYIDMLRRELNVMEDTLIT